MSEEHRTIINSKGYGILKNSLTKDEEQELKEELTVKPNVLPDYDFGDNKPYPVYRFNSTRYYVPKYWGIDKYGPPDHINEIEGDEIDHKFNGQLKPHQTNFISRILETIKENGSCIACSSTGSGKCFSKDTPILMYDGNIKMVQDVVVGDELMGDDSLPRKVLSLGRGSDIMYEIIPEHGESHTVNSEHIMCLKINGVPQCCEISMNNYLQLPEILQKNLLLYKSPVQFPLKNAPHDPYIMGFKIGTSEESYTIPEEYKLNVDKIRIRFLAGLIDGCGRLSKKKLPMYIFTKQDDDLITDVIYLARSLGFCIKRNKSEIEITGKIWEIPVKKRENKIDNFDLKEDVLIHNFKVVEKPRDNYYGFEIDGNRRFLLGDFTVTHNTVMTLWLMSQLKKRTMILVHKQFLLDQWVERIKTFLPKASIGIVQQDVTDVDKDIIIGMIQTITKRKYEPGTFNNIGLCAVDEIHHLSSRTFSRIPYIVNPKYTLGLSATPKRKDGLTKVIEWFFGDIIVNYKKSEIEVPMVKFIEAVYTSELKPKYNWKKKLITSNMETQIAADEGRTQQIIDEILKQSKTGRKILVLSSRRGHCEYMKKMLDKHPLFGKNLKTTGLYLGGMTEAQLSESNRCDVILATYSMAYEGYDNPDLDTLIMATGRGDVEQACGRILRKCNKFRPLIVDFTDPEWFGGQLRRRIMFYKRKGYIESESGEPFKEPKKRITLDEPNMFD